MTITVGGTTITFNDGTTQSTAAGAPTTTQVLNATAGASIGAVGTYAFMYNTAGGETTPGTTRAGSVLRYTPVAANWASTPIPSGTWRCMGYLSNAGCVGSYGLVTVFLRIS